MIVILPDPPKRTRTTSHTGSDYNHASFPNSRPSQALLEEDAYMAQYAMDCEVRLALKRAWRWLYLRVKAWAHRNR